MSVKKRENSLDPEEWENAEELEAEEKTRRKIFREIKKRIGNGKRLDKDISPRKKRDDDSKN